MLRKIVRFFALGIQKNKQNIPRSLNERTGDDLLCDYVYFTLVGVTVHASKQQIDTEICYKNREEGEQHINMIHARLAERLQ